MLNFPNILPQPLPANDGTPPDRQTTAPQAGETTGPQPTVYPWPGGYGDFCANGGVSTNPCGFWGYGSLYLGHYTTYDWMLQHPTIQHARSMVFDAIISAPPSFESVKGVAKKRLDFVKGVVTAIWPDFIADVLRALDYGWAGFEKVWAVRKSMYEYECLKPLNVNTNQIVADPNGRFAGIDVDGNRENRLGVHKSFLFTYDGKFGNLYGRARLENFRATAWRDWLDAATDVAKLSKKISGKLGILSTPAGSFKTSDGTTKNWSDLAASVGALLTSDASLLHLYHMGTGNMIVPGQANFDQFVAALKASAVNLDIKDFGSNSPAIGSLIERMKHDEELMFAGYFQSPRTGMATQGGTKADAQQHTDTGVANAENLSACIAQAFNRQVVDDLLVLNYGEAARGTVWITPAKLTDDNVATDMAILNGILTNPDGLGTAFLEQINVNPICERRGITHDADIVLEAVESDPADDTMAGDEADDTLAGDNGEQ